jgi:hypothetical protein
MRRGLIALSRNAVRSFIFRHILNSPSQKLRDFSRAIREVEAEGFMGIGACKSYEKNPQTLLVVKLLSLEPLAVICSLLPPLAHYVLVSLVFSSMS